MGRSASVARLPALNLEQIASHGLVAKMAARDECPVAARRPSPIGTPIEFPRAQRPPATDFFNRIGQHQPSSLLAAEPNPIRRAGGDEDEDSREAAALRRALPATHTLAPSKTASSASARLKKPLSSSPNQDHLGNVGLDRSRGLLSGEAGVVASVTRLSPREDRLGETGAGARLGMLVRMAGFAHYIAQGLPSFDRSRS